MLASTGVPLRLESADEIVATFLLAMIQTIARGRIQLLLYSLTFSDGALVTDSVLRWPCAISVCAVLLLAL